MSKESLWKDWTAEDWANATYCKVCGLPMFMIEPDEIDNGSGYGVGRMECAYCDWMADEAIINQKHDKTPIPDHVKNNLISLRKFANELSAIYDAPVYLVGSALSGNNPTPRDWDIRIILKDKEFEKRFGNVEKWEIEGRLGTWTHIRWNWSDECVARSKRGWEISHLNIDFQIYPKHYSDNKYSKSLPKLQINTRRGE